MEKPIGGYLEWEFSACNKGFPNDDGILLNSGHHALQYILEQLECITKVYIPYFTCDIILTPLRHLGIKYEFYRINDRLEIAEHISLGATEYLIYTNYFGIKDIYVGILYEQYKGQLIIDNAQAFFFPPIKGCFQFYSPRKFVGCPDGGIVSPKIINNITLEESKSYDLCTFLLQRADDDVESGYINFRKASTVLRNDSMKKMSLLTRKILNSLDYDKIKESRNRNFRYLHKRLQSSNMLSGIIKEHFECPLVYPYYSVNPKLREALINDKIFVAKYWPNVTDWCSQDDLEYKMANHLIALPIDQRYDEKDMDRILDVIYESNN